MFSFRNISVKLCSLVVLLKLCIVHIAADNIHTGNTISNSSPTAATSRTMITPTTRATSEDDSAIDSVAGASSSRYLNVNTAATNYQNLVLHKDIGIISFDGYVNHLDISADLCKETDYYITKEGRCGIYITRYFIAYEKFNNACFWLMSSIVGKHTLLPLGCLSQLVSIFYATSTILHSMISTWLYVLQFHATCQKL